VRDIVAMQERAGLKVVTDGEFRRTNWKDVFFDTVEGFGGPREELDFAFRLNDGGSRKGAPVPRVTAPLARKRGMATGDFAALRPLTRRVAKVMLPAPSNMHFYKGDAVNAAGIYRDVPAYMAEVARLYREELAELAALGCTYVQFDDVALPVLCDPAQREVVRRRGEDPDALVDLYVEALNQAVRDRPADMTVALHMCRGNVDHGMAAGGYDWIAERVFPRLDVDRYLLEYDTPRAGDFAPLGHLPKGKVAALGLVSTKLEAVETPAALTARLDEASRIVEPERLALCPQCGFASAFKSRRLAEAVQERKLALLAETAAAYWR
jgi:5-methyltetrahydropteroyltriglutamate--homocysteine methyltransferase